MWSRGGSGTLGVAIGNERQHGFRERGEYVGQFPTVGGLNNETAPFEFAQVPPKGWRADAGFAGEPRGGQLRGWSETFQDRESPRVRKGGQRQGDGCVGQFVSEKRAAQGEQNGCGDWNAKVGMRGIVDPAAMAFGVNESAGL